MGIGAPLRQLFGHWLSPASAGTLQHITNCNAFIKSWDARPQWLGWDVGQLEQCTPCVMRGSMERCRVREAWSGPDKGGL